MRLGFSLRSTAGRGRPTLTTPLASAATAVIARRWLDVAVWDDTLSWKDAV